MRIEVLNTGTELLLGKTSNTHAAYFGQELFKLGLRVQRQTTVPDGDPIRVALKEAFKRSDLVLVTGGLGPTSDDLTREVAAHLLKRCLVLDRSIAAEIDRFFRSRELEPPDSNLRQAMVPEGATVLANPHGTAPGLYLPPDPARRSPHLFLLPGPPRELKPMFETEVVPRLAALSAERGEELRTWTNFRIHGIGESQLASVLGPELGRVAGLELGYCARLGEVDLRLIGSAATVEAAAAAVRQAFAEDIVAESESPIEEVLVALLRERGETVSTAESCTGGGIAATLTDAPGASAVFHQGYVTYSNEAKTSLLGVPEALLLEHGAVSEPVVRAMAEGCLRESGSDHAIAVSGIAGPTGGTPEKPVGTVHLAVASRGRPTYAKRQLIPTDRISFKLRVTRLALDLLRRRLRGFLLD